MKRTPLALPCLTVTLACLAGFLAGCTSAPETTSQAPPPVAPPANAAPAAGNTNVPANAQSQAGKLGYNTNNAK